MYDMRRPLSAVQQEELTKMQEDYEKRIKTQKDRIDVFLGYLGHMGLLQDFNDWWGEQMEKADV